MKKIEFEKSKTIINLAKTYVFCSVFCTRINNLAKKCLREGFNGISDSLKVYSKNAISISDYIFNCIYDNANDLVANIELTNIISFKSGKELHQELNFFADYINTEITNLVAYSVCSEQEGFKEIASKFLKIVENYKSFEKFINEISKKIKDNKLYKYNKKTTIVCTNCGYKETVLSGWKRCPLCDYPNGFIKN